MSDFKAIVIGSGFGGAVVACRLVEAGHSICVLERGRRYTSQPPEELKDGERPWSDFPDLPSEHDALPDPKRWAWGDDQGLWELRNLGGIMAVQAAGYGGGSLIYANVHLRAPEEVFGGWPFARKDLDPYYDLTAYMMNVKPITEKQAPMPEKTCQFRKAAERLEREAGFFYPPLAVNFDGKNVFGRSQIACNDCGECITGCRYRAKNSLDFNYLARVDDSPLAEVRTQAQAVSIASKKGGGYKVKYIDHLRGGLEMVASAEWVFVCAGAINSTELLFNSANTGGLPNLNKDKLGSRFYPNADFPAIVYDARTPELQPRLLSPAKGPTITASLYHDTPSGSRRAEQKPWCIVQEGGFPVQMARHMGVFRAPALLRRNRHDDRALRAGEITPVSGKASPTDLLPSPDGDPPLLRSMMDGLYAILKNESETLRKIAHDDLLRAVQTLENEFTSFQDHHLRETIRAVRKKVLSRGCLKWIPDCLADWLIPIEDMLADTKRVLFERYSLGPTGRERVELVTRLASWLLAFHDASGSHSQNSMILLGMGPDALGGSMKIDAGELQVEMERGWDASVSETESLMRDVACALGGKLRVNPLWSFARTPVTVHSQGGCPMSKDAGEGVTNSYGQVHGHAGLFVMDAAAFPTSIGVNPSATIAAVAERNMEKLLGETADKSAAAKWWNDQTWTRHPDVALEPRRSGGKATVNRPVGIAFHETMSGFHWPEPQPDPADDAAYREAEVRGREQGSVLSIDLGAKIEDVAAFIHSEGHTFHIQGTAELVWNAAGIGQKTEYPVSGTLTLPGYGDLEQRMEYDLRFKGVDIGLNGFKQIRNDPGTDVWRDTSRLLVTLSGPSEAHSYGVIHVPLDGFLFDQLPSFRVLNTDDPARIAWALSSFGAYFFRGLQRVYLPQLDKVVEGFANLEFR